MDRTQTITMVKEWMQLDVEIASLKRQAKMLDLKKKDLTKLLVGVMKDNHIDEFDLSDGKLVRQTQKSKSPLTKKHLAGCFTKFFKGNLEPAKELSEIVFNTREEKTSERIVCRKKNKGD